MARPPDDAFSNFTTEVSVTESVTTISDENYNYNVTMVDIVMEQLAMTLNVYYTPVLIILGCLGNLLSIIVFFKSKLRLQSTSQYLSVLALSDMLFLCQLLPPWLKAVGASTLFSREGYCQLFVYLSYVTCNLSSWLVVAFTVERFVAVVYPLQRNAMCTVKRARHIIGSLAMIALVINIPVLRFAVPNGNDCNIDEVLMDHAARFNLVDTVFSFTVPLAVIVVLNTWIMWGVYRVSRARPSLMRQQDCPGRAWDPQSARATASQRSQQRVTRMLLIVSSVFVLLNLPAYTMRIVAYANDMSEHEYNGKWAALQQVCLLFFNTNFGINFVLYCMTGQNFRRALLETLPCIRRRERALITLRGRGENRQPRASSGSTSFVHSFSNNYTEATTNTVNSGVSTVCGRDYVCQAGYGRGRTCGSQLEVDRVETIAEPRGRRRSQKVIQRWRFDNSRQQRQRLPMEIQTFEMRQMPSTSTM